MGGHRRPNSEIVNSIGLMEKRFPTLAERRKKLARTLSGGEQQMLAIARGLMAKPEPSLI
jgi:branched-chain amino acid transport system ATP-binding protein